jgi:hypothetical protein
MSMPSNLLMRAYNSFARYRHARAGHAAPVIAANQRHDDLYLVEFPKSGITWLCFLVANTNLLLSGDRQRSVTFFNIQRFIPAINTIAYLGPPETPVPGFRFIMSHATFNPNYISMFYMVRDPRDVMASYHKFLGQTGWFGGTLEEMVRHKDLGISAWCEHVSGWIDNVAPSRAFALVRYEDLLADPVAELKTLYRLVGFDLSDEIAATAVERSGIKRMRAEEQLFNARHPMGARMQFVRKGKPGGPREAMPESVLDEIERIAGPLMARLGYGGEPGERNASDWRRQPATRQD